MNIMTGLVLRQYNLRQTTSGDEISCPLNTQTISLRSKKKYKWNEKNQITLMGKV